MSVPPAPRGRRARARGIRPRAGPSSQSARSSPLRRPGTTEHVPATSRRAAGLPCVIARHRDRGQSLRAGAVHVRRPPCKQHHADDSVQGWGASPSRRAGHRQHLRRTGHGKARSAERRATRHRVASEGIITPPRSHPHPSSSNVARDHTRPASPHSTRGGHTSTASRPRPSSSCRSPATSRARSNAPEGRSATDIVWRGSAVQSRAKPASGQPVNDQQIDRHPPAPACERRVIRATRHAAPPAAPHARPDIHRAGQSRPPCA